MVEPRIAPIVYVMNKPKAKQLVNAKDNNGKSVLQYLIQSKFVGNVNLYKALKAAGVNVTQKDLKDIRNKLKGKPKLKLIVNLLQKK